MGAGAGYELRSGTPIGGSSRWSRVDLDSGAVNGGKSDIFSAGLNWWAHEDLMASVNWRYVSLDRNGVAGESHAIVARLQLLLD